MRLSTANLRLSVGLLMLPAILLQDNLVGVALQAGYIILLALTHGRRFKLLPNLIILLSVSAAHLLQPNGLRLFSLGTFPITAGALALGARKALVLIGLLYLSQFMITGRPTFPGWLGKIISLQFYYFERITTEWKNIRKRPFIGALDTLLFSLERIDTSQNQTNLSQTKLPGRREWALGGLHVGVLWGLYLLGAFEFLPALV